MNINFNEITNEADIWLTANEKNNEKRAGFQLPFRFAL